MRPSPADSGPQQIGHPRHWQHGSGEHQAPEGGEPDRVQILSRGVAYLVPGEAAVFPIEIFVVGFGAEILQIIDWRLGLVGVVCRPLESGGII